jgi:hypothetical protein
MGECIWTRHTNRGVGAGVRRQLLFRSHIEEKSEFASMEAQYIIVQSDNGIIRVLFFFVLLG